MFVEALQALLSSPQAQSMIGQVIGQLVRAPQSRPVPMPRADPRGPMGRDEVEDDEEFEDARPEPKKVPREYMTKRDMHYWNLYAPNLPMPDQSGSQDTNMDQRMDERVKRDEQRGEKGVGTDGYFQGLIEDLMMQDLMRDKLPHGFHTEGTGETPGNEWMGELEPDAEGNFISRNRDMGLRPYLNPEPMENWQETDDLIYVPGKGWCTPDGEPVGPQPEMM